MLIALVAPCIYLKLSGICSEVIFRDISNSFEHRIVTLFLSYYIGLKIYKKQLRLSRNDFKTINLNIYVIVWYLSRYSVTHDFYQLHLKHLGNIYFIEVGSIEE